MLTLLMKTKKHISVILVIIILLPFALTGCYDVQPTNHTYVVPSNICKARFALSPEEFVQDPYPFGWSGDFCESAEIDKHGSLVLTLSDSQQQIWFEKSINMVNEAIEKGFAISDDRLEIVTTYSTVMNHPFTLLSAIDACLDLQILNKYSPEMLYIDLIIIDDKTGAEISRTKYPFENIRINYKDGQFSSN